MNREIEKKKGKVFSNFADLKAVFNRMNRKILKEKMEEIGVIKKLLERENNRDVQRNEEMIKIKEKCIGIFLTT